MTENETPKKGNNMPKVFNDPVHGHIELPIICHKIVDTPQFQRLRYLKQLGGVYYVYPGASHNRFEHSLGVCHLAGQFLREIKSRQPDWFGDKKEMISEDDITCVQIAGLCHDLGHGPLSHVFDKIFLSMQKPIKEGEKKRINLEHEDRSKMIFSDIIDKESAKGTKCSFDEKELKLLRDNEKFIKDLITGDVDEEMVKTSPKKRFLFEIVANKRNQIDVDKFDYFARDCHHLGMKNDFDHNRYMKFARVFEIDNEYHICIRDKDASHLHELFNTRYILHRRAYQHKVTRIVEYMFVEALQHVDDIIKLNGKNISESIEDPDAFRLLDDSIFRHILTLDEKVKKRKREEEKIEEAEEIETNPEEMKRAKKIKEAKGILEKIESRNLYPYIGVAFAPKEIFDEEKIKDHISRGSGPHDKVQIDRDYIVVLNGSFNFGNQNNDPLKACWFYKKDIEAKPITFEELNMPRINTPIQFQEFFVHVYYKKSDDTKATVVERFQKYIQELNIQPKEYCNTASHQNKQCKDAATDMESDTDTATSNVPSTTLT